MSSRLTSSAAGSSEDVRTVSRWRSWIGIAHSAELACRRFAGLLADHADDLPVPELAGLGHGQELEAVELASRRAG